MIITYTLESVYRTMGFLDGSDRADLMVKYARRLTIDKNLDFFDVVDGIKAALLGEPRELEEAGVDLGADFLERTEAHTEAQRVVKRDDEIATALWRACQS